MVARVRAYCCGAWERGTSASIETIARAAARTILGISVGRRPEDLTRSAQRRYFDLLSVIAAARSEYLSRLRETSALDRLAKVARDPARPSRARRPLVVTRREGEAPAYVEAPRARHLEQVLTQPR